MQRRSWSSFAAQFERRPYAYAEAVGTFIQRAADEPDIVAVILFGSLARGDYHHSSDADICVLLRAAPATPFAGYDRIAPLDPSGAVQPVVYGADQFGAMLDALNGLALEVMADGVLFVGSEAVQADLERRFAVLQQERGLERTRGGWKVLTPI